MQDASGSQPDESGHFAVTDRRLEDPPVQVATATLGNFAYGCPQHLGADQAHFIAMMGMNDEFEGERIVTFADLGISDRVIVAWFPGHESRETLASTVDEIEPEVIGQRPMSICPLSRSDQIAHDREIIAMHLAFDVENVHAVTLPLRPWSSPRGARGLV